jgi:hypothetical protein
LLARSKEVGQYFMTIHFGIIVADLAKFKQQNFTVSTRTNVAITDSTTLDLSLEPQLQLGDARDYHRELLHSRGLECHHIRIINDELHYYVVMQDAAEKEESSVRSQCLMVLQLR